jgi:hypothetical protein
MSILFGIDAFLIMRRKCSFLANIVEASNKGSTRTPPKL